MSRHTRASLATGAVVALLAVAGSGAAYAYWAGTGTGAGSASTGTMTIAANVLAGSDQPTGSLIPGRSSDAVVSITNPNGFPVTLYSVAGRGAVTASNGCAPTGVTFLSQSGLTISIPTGATQLVHLNAAVAMDSTSANACQGATFSIPVTVTVRK